jgi:hypothetical protein
MGHFISKNFIRAPKDKTSEKKEVLLKFSLLLIYVCNLKLNKYSDKSISLFVTL